MLDDELVQNDLSKEKYDELKKILTTNPLLLDCLTKTEYHFGEISKYMEKTIKLEKQALIALKGD